MVKAIGHTVLYQLMVIAKYQDVHIAILRLAQQTRWYTLSVEKLKEYLRIAIEANTNLLNTIDVSDFKLYCKGKIDAFQSVLDELR